MFSQGIDFGVGGLYNELQFNPNNNPDRCYMKKKLKTGRARSTKAEGVVQITTIAELNHFASSGKTEYFITLNYGVISRKTIQYDPEQEIYAITNHIDGDEQELSLLELMDWNLTLIGSAMKLGALYLEAK